MKIFPNFIQGVLLITTPTLIAYPTGEIPKLVIKQASHHSFQLPDLRTLSYDQVIDLLALIESDGLDKTYSEDDLNQINQLISFLAIEGAADNEKFDMANAAASLFRKDSVQYALFTDAESSYIVEPAIYSQDPYDIVLCKKKSWFKKQWKQTKKFVKNHKKAIIVGAIVVVTVAVVVVAAVAISATAATAAAAAGGALASPDHPTSTPDGSSYSKDDELGDSTPNESLTSSWKEQVSSFKETIVKEQFSAVSEPNGISLEENGRIIGSFFAHKTVESLTASAASNPSIAAELNDLGLYAQYPTPQWEPTYPGSYIISPHHSADLAFSTDYTASYAGSFSDSNACVYQARGDLALSSEYYGQAVQDFGKAISINPSNPILYLERGIANFELGNYEDSLTDYSHYIEKKGEPFSVTDFSIGFAKGVPEGVYESGKGALLFLSHFIENPVQTAKQVVESLNELVILVKNDELGVVAEALSPELHQLVTQWDTLSSRTKGELAGYAVGKLGTDLIAPGAAAKVASKSVNSAKEFLAVCRNIQIAQETLILETASGIGIPAKVSEIVEMGKKTANIAEELGFTTKEMAQLQQARKLETTVARACEHLSPPMKESFELFERAQDFLKQHKGFMPESRARDLIHQTGIRTFPRPEGIPQNYRVQISDKGAGIFYIHPNHNHTSIRVMPGKPHSPYPYQQKPYVIHKKDGKALDKFGNQLDNSCGKEAHIPYEEFIYRG